MASARALAWRPLAGLGDLLTDMLGSRGAKPRVCFTGRGPGLYSSLTGEIVQADHSALKTYKFRPFAGAGVSWQPSDLADFFLHEAVVAWVRKWFRKRPFKAVEDVDVNCQRFLERLQECEDHINRSHNVDGLCRKVVERLNDLCERKGGRLPH